MDDWSCSPRRNGSTTSRGEAVMIRMVLPNDPASVRGVARAGGWLAGAVLLGFLVAGTPRGADAGSVERMGTNGAPELLISVGPRSNALGGNAVADVTGSEALFWNPAGLAVLKGTEVVLSHIDHIGETDVNFFSIATKAGSIGDLGVVA